LRGQLRQISPLGRGTESALKLETAQYLAVIITVRDMLGLSMNFEAA
jgi:hypothetical protein